MHRIPPTRHVRNCTLIVAAVFVVSVFASAGTVNIYPGTDIANVVDSNPAGTKFVIYPGTYRQGNITPKNGDSFIGSTACAPPKTSCPAILSGAHLLTTFERSGTYYYATDQSQQGQVTIASQHCEPMNPGYPIAYPGCVYPNDLFFDGVPLVHVTSLANVGSGTWYFDYASQRIYLYDDPAGHTVETSVVPYAFTPGGPANNVTIKYLTIEKYASPILSAPVAGIAIGFFGSQTRGANWVVQDNEIALNHGAGIVMNFGWKILNNYIHNNGNFGFSGAIGGGNRDGSGTQSSNTVVQGNEVAHNNFAHVSPHFGAGGSKGLYTYNIVYRNNYVHNNEGSGIHSDTDNYGALYDGNTVADNTEQGIFHEISYHAIVRNNKLLRNGYIHPTNTFWLFGANLLSSISQGVTAYCNTVEVSAQGGNGMDIISEQNTLGKVSANNYFHHNTLVFDGSSGWTGGGRGSNSDPAEANFFTTNRYDYNLYLMPSLSRHAFAWENKVNTFAEFQALGEDTHGSANTAYQASIPVVSINSPADQSTVSGTVAIAATATDPGSISKVEFMVDWNLATTKTAEPYTFNWSTGGLAAGSHVITAMAFSPNGTHSCYAVTLNVK
jgi:Bacterial Ig domain/Right handed beta helix region